MLATLLWVIRPIRLRRRGLTRLLVGHLLALLSAERECNKSRSHRWSMFMSLRDLCVVANLFVLLLGLL